MSRARENKQGEQRVLESLSNALDKDVEQLDSVTLTRLAAARRSATSKKGAVMLQPWSVGAGLASMALLVMIVMPHLMPPESVPEESVQLTSSAKVFEDLSVLAGGEGIDFYQSVDFLIWLESTTGSEG